MGWESLHVSNIILKFATEDNKRLWLMLEILIISGILAYAILGMGHILAKVGSRTHLSSLTSNDNEDCEEPIPLLSPHNSVSEITQKNGRYFITIENSVTGDKKTVSNRFKKYLCWEAHDVAFDFAVKERKEYHTC